MPRIEPFGPEGASCRRRVAYFAAAFLAPTVLTVGYLVLRDTGVPEPEAKPAVEAPESSVSGKAPGPDRPESPMPWLGGGQEAGTPPGTPGAAPELTDDMRKAVQGAFGGLTPQQREANLRAEATRNRAPGASRPSGPKGTLRAAGSVGAGGGGSSASLAVSLRPFLSALLPGERHAIGQHVASGARVLEACQRARLTASCEAASAKCLKSSDCAVALALAMYGPRELLASTASSEAGAPAAGGVGQDGRGDPSKKAAGSAGPGGGRGAGGEGSGGGGQKAGELKELDTPTTKRMKALLEEYPWLKVIGEENIRLLIVGNDIRDHGLWGACFKLGIYAKCAAACSASGRRCLAPTGWKACLQWLTTDAACAAVCKQQPGCEIAPDVLARLCPRRTLQPNRPPPPPLPAFCPASAPTAVAPAATPTPTPSPGACADCSQWLDCSGFTEGCCKDKKPSRPCPDDKPDCLATPFGALCRKLEKCPAQCSLGTHCEPNIGECVVDLTETCGDPPKTCTGQVCIGTPFGGVCRAKWW